MNEKDLIHYLEIFNHKLKNPLHGLGLNLDVLRNRLRKNVPGNSDLLKHVDIASRESERMRQITLRFIEYLKMPDSQRQKVDLNSLLERGTGGK